MANHVIVGAGAAGLYTAYRLLSSGALAQDDTVQLYEWGDRPGGRIFTYTFPDEVGGNGLYCEFGGMRFAVDGANFANGNPISEGHVLVQYMIREMGLSTKVVDFHMSTDRLYYLRGTQHYESALTTLGPLPYQFDARAKAYITGNVKPPHTFTADNILGAIAGTFAPSLEMSNSFRQQWCDYFGTGTVQAPAATRAFPEGTLVSGMGYWNLLFDQLGDEGFDYVADATGYTSNVINWNAADAMQANNDYGSGSTYMRLDGGYSVLFEALAAEITGLAENYPGSGIRYGQQLTCIAEATDGTTTCQFLREGGRERTETAVSADFLYLAMPRRALEMVGNSSGADSLLNRAAMQYFIESSVDQPAIKVVLLFDTAWWTDPACKFPPRLVDPMAPNGSSPQAQWVGGDSITDLPLRMIYYFGNNVPGGPGVTGGPYVVLASYDDMNYAQFWNELETQGVVTTAPSLRRQPLSGPTALPTDSAMAELLLRQLADVHGMPVELIPPPTALYYQDWGQDPYGAGYHGWAAHYNICEAMDRIRAPYQRIFNEADRRVFIIGSCYSFDQAWVEGAFCTAESVLQEFINLPQFVADMPPYTLVCKTGTA